MSHCLSEEEEIRCANSAKNIALEQQVLGVVFSSKNWSPENNSLSIINELSNNCQIIVKQYVAIIWIYLTRPAQVFETFLLFEIYDRK